MGERPSPEIEDLVFRCLEAEEGGGEQRVDAILAEHPALAARARRILARLRGVAAPARVDEAPEIPPQLGPFRLGRQLGAGGMGVVYEAVDEALGRRVALKLVHPQHLYFPGHRERFRREVEAVARLAHPGIVPIYSVGEEAGLPYYAMELVDGCSLADVVRALRARPADALDGRAFAEVLGASVGAPFDGSHERACLTLVAQVADALRHAHERGVLHRDVKPSNVMLSRDGVARLVDFGLALTDDGQRMTREGAAIGSLAYMAPEQVRGDLAAIDARTDVHAVGVLLYELVSLRSPYLAADSEVTRRNILEARAAPLRAIEPKVGSDTAAVCAVAMDGDPARRYASMAALHEDLQNVLTLRPILARPPGPLRRAQRFAARNPALAALLAVAAALAIGLPVAYLSLVVAERDAAIAARTESERLRRVDQRRSYGACVAAAAYALRHANTVDARDRLEACPEHLRGWEWRHLMTRLDASAATLAGHDDFVRRLQWFDDGRSIASCSADGTVRIWDAATGATVRRLPIDDGQLLDVAVAQRSRTLLVAAASGAVRALDLDDGAERYSFALSQYCAAVAVTADEQRFAAASIDGAVEVRRVADGERLAAFRLPPRRAGPWSLCFSPDGARLFAGVDDVVLAVDPGSGTVARRYEGHEGFVLSLALSADGERLLTAGQDRTARVFEVATGLILRTMRGHTGEVFEARWCAGDAIVTAGGDGTIRRWSADGVDDAVLLGHASTAYGLAVAPDGRTVASGGLDKTVRIWDLGAGRTLRRFRAHGRSVAGLVLDHDGAVVSIDSGGAVAAHATRTGAAVALPFGAPADEVHALAIAAHPSGDGGAVAFGDGRVVAWSSTGARELCRVAAPEVVRVLAFARGGGELVVGARSGDVWTVGVDDGERRDLGSCGADPSTLVVAPSGDRVVVGDSGRSWRCFRLGVAGAEWRVDVDAARLFAAAFLPDGRLLTATDRTFQLRDPATGDVVREFEGHAGTVQALAVSPDGSRIVSGAQDKTVRFWTVEERHALLTMPNDLETVTGLAFAADGEMLLLSGIRGRMAVWQRDRAE